MTIKNDAQKLQNKLIEMRRFIHENPELGFEEIETSKYIKNKLDALGIPYKSGFAKTGIIASIEGEKKGKSLLIRADIDALPIQEANNVEYKSKRDGIMHACGHDTHITCLLGAAELLVKRKSEINGIIYLVFQPAEEFRPGFYDVPGGALPMINEGAVGSKDNPIHDAAIALHVVTNIDAGEIGLRSGPSTGSGDIFKIHIQGKGGHASAPHLANDPVFVAVQIYTGIQTFLTRFVSPLEPYVFTVGKIEIGDRSNIISEKGYMEGTFRTLNEELRNQFYELIPKLVSDIASTYNASAEVTLNKGYSVGVNDEFLADCIGDEFKKMYGEKYLIKPEPVLGAEDFYEFGMNGKVPTCMFLLGGRNTEKGISAPNHSNFFDIDESALQIGVATFTASAIRILNELKE